MGSGNETSAPDARLTRWQGPARRAAAELPFLLAAALVATVAAWPVLSVHRDGLKSDVASYLEIFNASAMFATGHGFVEGELGCYPELRAFLHGESVRLAAPANPEAVRSFPLRYPFARSHYYLLLAVGCWWWMFGVSVASFLAFAGVVYVLCILTVYALFRVGCGRAVSLLGALCMATSPAWLMMAPSLRDFAKAPFVLAFLALAGWCTRGRLSGRGLVGWSLLTGSLLGAGWGFRSDLLVCLPPALLLPWVVRLDGAHGWRWRLSAAVALLLTFSLLGAPVFLATRNNGGALYVHSVMQGLSDRSESAMSFGDASYTGFSDWCDPSAHAAAAAYALNRGDLPPMENFDSPSYLQAARLYFSDMMRTFPADFFRRGLASAWSVSGVPAAVCRGDHAAGPETVPILDRWIGLHQPLAAHLETFGMLYLLLALAVACAINLRTAAILAVLAVYIGAYPSLLYQTRHVFHLSCLYYWAPAWLLVQSGCWAWHRMRAHSAGPILRPLLRAVAGMAVFLALLAGTGWCLERVQQRSVHRLLAQYRDARLEPVPYRETPHGDGWVLLTPVKPVPGLEPERELETYEAATALLVLRVEGGAPVFPVRMVYAHGSVTDFTQDFYPLLEKGSDAAGFNCFLPVIELAWPGPVSGDASGAAAAGRGRFLGVAVPVAQRAHVAGLSRVTNAAQTPYPLFMAVPDDPERFIQPKSGPWDRLWPMFSVCCAGTPLDRAARLAGLAERHPRDTATLRALEQLTDSAPDPLTQVRAWQTLAGLHPDRVTDAGVELDRLAEGLAAAGDNESALRVYEAAVTVASAALWHRENLGKQYERMGRSKDALEQYVLRLSAQPDSPDLADRVDRLFGGDHAAALAFWKDLAERHPEASVPAHHLARTCRAAGDLPSALAAHERAFALKADQPQQLLKFGADLLAARQGDRALEMLRQAARLDATLAPAAADLCAKAAAERLGAGDSAAAAALANAAVLLRPDDRRLRMEAAAAMKAAGDAAGAVAALSEVMAANPDAYAAAQLDQMLETFAPEEGVSRWRKLADGHPNCMECRVRLGAALERAGRPDEARQVYEDTLRVDPKLPGALLRLGSLLSAQGREDEGLPMVDRAAVADADLASDAGRVFAAAAARYAGAGDLARAEALYRRASALDPGDVWLLTRLAGVLERAGKAGDAAELLGDALRENPELPYCAEALDALLAAGPPEQRLARWQEIGTRHPEAALPRFYQGRALDALGHADEAGAAYRAALDADPALHAARIALAMLETSGGDAESGLSRLRALVDEKRVPPNQIVDAFVEAVRRLADRGEAHRALDLCMAGLAVFPDAPPLLFGKAELLERTGDRDGAVDACLRLLSAVPEAAQTAARLDGLCGDDAAGRKRRAVLWRGIVSAHPDAAVPNLHLGLALEASGDAVGAAAAYRKALGANPDLPPGSALLEKARRGGEGGK